MTEEFNPSTSDNRLPDNQPGDVESSHHQTIEEQMSQLVRETCKHPPNSSQRRKGLSQLIRLIHKSGKLWRKYTPYYEDALQMMWQHLCRNLCEAPRGGQYDPSRGSVTTWLNWYLKRRLQDLRSQAEAEKKRRTFPQSSDAQETLNFIENIAADPDIPPILEETRHWAETDPDGELNGVHIKGRPDITCQVLILRRLPPETSWKTLADEFNCSLPTLAGFYKKQCRPRLRKFGKSQGYL